MDKNFNMKLHVLNCNVLHGKHTAINLAKRYNDIFLEYKLEGYIQGAFQLNGKQPTVEAVADAGRRGRAPRRTAV